MASHIQGRKFRILLNIGLFLLAYAIASFLAGAVITVGFFASIISNGSFDGSGIPSTLFDEGPSELLAVFGVAAYVSLLTAPASLLAAPVAFLTAPVALLFFVIPEARGKAINRKFYSIVGALTGIAWVVVFRLIFIYDSSRILADERASSFFSIGFILYILLFGLAGYVGGNSLARLRTGILRAR